MLRLFSCFLLLLLGMTSSLRAESSVHTVRMGGILEVNNQVELSDFGMGSTETIRDQNGTGAEIGVVIRRGEHLFLEVVAGQSQTVYQGIVEDGVTVDFLPKEGTEFEVISSSTNVKYDFDLTFQNPFAGLNILLGFDPSRVFFLNSFYLGFGRIFQAVSGSGITLSTQGIEIVKATYEPSQTQGYFQLGLIFDLDGIYFLIGYRSFQAPNLIIESCNEAALGALVCERVKGAANNRNQRSTNFSEMMFGAGISF